MKTNKIFWLLTIGIFAGLLIPGLVQDGMFLDGVTYSSVARNLANGIGSFWKPHYTKILYPDFFEHPPLVFWIQSLFFKILGDGIYTERIYTFLTAVITAFGIVLCWRLFNKEDDLKKYSWLPVLLWIITPVIFWSYKNNLLENTMGIFTLFSVYFISKSLLKEKMTWLFLASLFIVLAFLSKGFTGVFPMVAVIIYWLTFRNKSKRVILQYSLTIILLPSLLFLLLILVFPQAKENFLSYLQHQLVPALNGQKDPTTGNHFTLFFDLIRELALPVFIFMIIIVRKYFSRKEFHWQNKKEIVFFFLIGISASLPIMVSLKQRAFYLVPSIPFFIMAASFLIAPYLKNKIVLILASVLLWIKVVAVAAFLFIIGFTIYKSGKYSRDEEKLHDVHLISKRIPSGTIIHTTPELWQDWSLVAYLCRTGYISMDCDCEHEYFLLKKTDTLDSASMKKYSKMELGLKKYIMLKKKIPEGN